MKIPRQFHQFKNEIALLIVSGSDAFDLYLAQNGNIERIQSYKEPIPHYLDREEFFTQSGPRKDGLIGSGSVYESKKNEVQHRLQKKIAKEIADIFKRNDISTIYILSPEFFLTQVQNAIPKIHRNKIRIKINQNLASKNEIMILKTITKYFEETIGQKEPINPDARNLLKNFDKAQNKKKA